MVSDVDTGTGGKERAIAYPQVWNVPGAAIRVDEAGGRVIAHAASAHQMRGAVFAPNVLPARRLDSLAHKVIARRYRRLSFSE